MGIEWNEWLYATGICITSRKATLPPSYCIAFATGNIAAIALLLVFSRYINKVPCAQYQVVLYSESHGVRKNIYRECCADDVVKC